jgi:hypothetical protein
VDAVCASFAAVVAALHRRLLVMAVINVDYTRAEQHVKATKAGFCAGKGFHWCARLAVQFKIADRQATECLPRMF